MDSLDNPTLTPGQVLRRQRQSIGWSVEDIANALCLAPDLIEELERDDFEGMGGSTFVLGYLRSYARMVNVDLEPTITSFRDKIPEYIPDPEHIPGSKRSSRRKTKRSTLDLALFTLAIVIAVGVGYLLISEYWWSTESNEIDENLLAEISSVSEVSIENESILESSLIQAPTLSDVVDAMTVESLIPLNLAIQGLEASSKVNDFSVSPGASASETSGANRLVLIFDEGSWVDVRDSAGQRLLSQTVSVGNTIELNGMPPFTVFLGNAGGVRVQYLGKIDSYSQSKKGLFARFIVGDQP